MNSNYTGQWCDALVELFLACGITHFFVAPGHRCAPIVAAIQKNPKAQIYCGYDERSLGFFALGFSKKSRIPSVVVMTSGTAVANLHPSVAEAYESDIPLIIFSADRPFELRDSAANQTMDQVGIFSSHVHESLDIPVPDPRADFHKSLGKIEQAIFQAVAQSGPVHINLQLRDPLNNVPHPHEGDFSLASVPKFNSKKFVQNSLPAQDFSYDRLSGKRVLVGLGECAPGPAQEAILSCAEKLNWAIYADVLSNLRFAPKKNVLKHFDLALSIAKFNEQFQPDVILYAGGRLVSKRFWAFVEGTNSELLRLMDTPKNYDQSGRFERVFCGPLAKFFEGVEKNVKSGPREFLSAQVLWNEKIATKILGFLEIPVHNEAYFACRLLNLTDQDINFFISSSMPIRYIDSLATSVTRRIDTLANRGVNGIDGVISSALGAALVDNKPMVLLIGDMAFLHDTNGLSFISQVSAPVMVIVLNNAGGGIFHHLEVAKNTELVTPYLDSPHQVSLGHLCRAHGIAHKIVISPKDFDICVREFFSVKKSIVLEVQTDKVENARHFKSFMQSINEIDATARQP